MRAREKQDWSCTPPCQLLRPTLSVAGVLWPFRDQMLLEYLLRDLGHSLNLASEEFVLTLL